MSLHDDILALDDMEKREITIKQWGGRKIIVKSLTATQRFALIERCMNAKANKIDGKKLYIHTFIECACDPDTGKQIFTADDYEKLASKHSGAIEAVVQVANELNGIGEAEISEMEKN
jgi:hypothetical protein